MCAPCCFQVGLRPKPMFSLNLLDLPEDFAYLFNWGVMRRGYICSFFLLGLILGYMTCMVAVCCRGNEGAARRNAKYYAFWREQHKARIAAAQGKKSKPTWKMWCKATVAQMKAQHKGLRVFFHQ